MEGPFEMRICEKLETNPKEVLPIQWVKFINQNFHPERITSNQTAPINSKAQKKLKCIIS